MKDLEQRVKQAPSLDEMQRLRQQIINLQALHFDHIEQNQQVSTEEAIKSYNPTVG